MIDEELYQFATDELNSDSRDSELWDRACALARGDHDEARFLYANLRVEELLEQVANGEPMPEMPDSVKGAASVAFDLDAAPNAVESASLGLDKDDALLSDPAQLAEEADEESKVTLDPLVFSDQKAVSDSGDTLAEFDLDAASALASDNPLAENMDMDIAALAAQASEQLQNNELSSDVNSLNADSIDTASLEDALDNTGSLDSTAFNTDQLDSLAAETGAFEHLDDSTIDTTATPLPDAVPETTTLNESELAFLDASIDKGRDDIIDQQREVLHQKDALTEELERQANSFLPEDNASVVSEINDSDTDSLMRSGASAAASTAASDLDDVFSDDNLAQITAQNNDSIADFDDADINSLSTDSAVNFAKDQGSQISHDFSQPGNLDSDDNSPSLNQTELLSGKGRTYRVFSKGPDNNRAVKTGVSWAALFFTLPWLLVKRMPLMAIVYALLWVVLAAGLSITGMHWLDAPKDAQSALAIWPIAFALLAVIGLIILPFFMGNRWHAGSLVSRGYEEIALVRAKGARRAIDRIMRMAA